MSTLHSSIMHLAILLTILVSAPLAAQEIIDIDMRVNVPNVDVSYSSEKVTVQFSFDGSIDSRAGFFNPNTKKNRGFSAYCNHREFKDFSIISADSGAKKFTVSIQLPANYDTQKTVIQFRFQDIALKIDRTKSVCFLFRKPKIYLFSSGQQYLNSNKRLSQQADTIFRSLQSNQYVEERFSVCAPVITLDEPTTVLKKKMNEFSGIKTRPSDVALIYLKGHGKTSGDKFSYLCADGKAIDDEAIARMITPFVNNNTRVFLFLDACYAGALGSKLSSLKDNKASLHFYMGADAKSEKKDDGGFAQRLSVALSERTISNNSINKALFPKVSSGSGGYMCYPKMEEFYFCNNEPVMIQYAEKPVKGVAPMLMSLAPGVGQIYKKEYLKGGLLTAGTFAGIGGIILCENQRQVYAAQITQTHDINVIRQLQANQQNMLVARNVFIGATALVYVYNLVDAAVAPGNRKVQLTTNGIAYAF